MAKITIIPYQPKYQAEFKRLNLEWLDKYDLTESHDLEILDDPEGTVIGKGGYIFLAMDDKKVVGTAGISKATEEIYELVKMAVDPQYRGMGISKILLDHCIEKANLLKAKKILLYSNSNLRAAIGLYEKYGFRHLPAIDSPFKTADIKMELDLDRPLPYLYPSIPPNGK